MYNNFSIDPSAIISGIALVVAILSPAITSYMNNRHEYKMYRLRFYEKHRAEAIEDYIRCTGAVILEPTKDNFTAYGKCYGEIFLYTPQKMWDNLREINLFISSNNYKEAETLFSFICQELAEYHPRSKKH
ncbi:MAG: hypothetical protein RSA49_05405 [Anaerovoracaceae bacterium]